MYLVDNDIRENIELFYRPVEMPGGWYFDHARTLRLIDLYHNSRFETGEFDEQGLKKYFHNIVKPACDVAEKMIDLDTRDVLLFSTNDSDEELRLYVMRQDLRDWMKRNGFAGTINELGAQFPKYGHIVTKRTKDGTETSPIHNLRMNPASGLLGESEFVYELIDMTRRDIRGMGAWYQDQVDRLFARCGDKNFVVYECHHQNDEPYGKPWVRTIRADLLRLKGDRNTGTNRSVKAMGDQRFDDFMPSVILYEDEVKELPYDEEKWVDVPGRWLGMGFVEDLFDPQMSRNEVTNLERRGLQWSSTKIVQSTEDVPQQNILSDVVDGQILRVRTPLTVLDFSERNLPAYREAKQDVDESVQKRTHSFDIATGANLPSNTPLGLGRIQAGMVLSYFDKKREKLGELLKRIITLDVLPTFKGERAAKHVVKFLGSEEGMDRLYSEAAKTFTRKKVIDQFLADGVAPRPGTYAEMRTKAIDDLKKRKELLIDVIDGYYDNAGEYVEVNVTGEQRDLTTLGQSLFTTLTAIAANPNIILDPRLRAVFTKMLEVSGISLDEIGILERKMAEAQPAPEMMAQLATGRPAQQQPQPAAAGSPMMSATLG